MDENFSDQRYLLEEGLLKELHVLFKHYQKNGGCPDDLFSTPPGQILEQAAQKLTEPYEETLEDAVFHSADVRSLGRREAKEGQEKNGTQDAAEAAYALAAGNRPFTLVYSSGKQPRFSIGAADEDVFHALEDILRAAFGQAVIQNTAEEKDEPGNIYRAYASCSLPLMDMMTAEQPVPVDLSGNWIDSLAGVLPGQRFEVKLEFRPLSGKWLSGRLHEIEELADLLEGYQEVSWQVSGNVGSGVNDTDPLILEWQNRLGGSRKISGSHGLAASLSAALHRNGAGRLVEELQFMAKRFRQMERAGGWAVYISAGARRREAMASVQAVLGGALARSGFHVSWEERERRQKRASVLLPTHMLHQLVHFPEKDFPGFTRKTLVDYEITPPTVEDGAPTFSMGNIIWNGLVRKELLGIPVEELNRHAFICGMTGSGKTNTVCHLLSVVKKPFMVIEPVKGEYRSLQKTIPGTEVYTMEAGSRQMLSVNPFWFPEGGSLQYHIDSLKTIIASAFDLYAAMPNILEQCLLRVYVHMGWNLITNRNIYEGRLPLNQLYPTFSDLCDEIEQYLNTSDFEGETKGNYKGALLSRLQSFTSGSKGILLNDNTTLPLDRWSAEGTNVIIELDALADDADKCIVMGTILAQYFQFIKYCVQDRKEHGLRHLVVLEEAHHLFMEDTDSSDGSSARKKLVESLSNLLAEIRSYGEGVLIVDQSPSRISPEVIKNTAVKIVHRLDYGRDMDMVRDALLLGGKDCIMACLDKGQAFIRYGIMSKPIMAALPLCESKENFIPEKTNRDIDTDCYLVRSIMDAVILNPVFEEEITISCGMFVNQILFDGLEGIRKARCLLWMQCVNLLYTHGYQELADSCGTGALISQLVIYGSYRYLNIEYPEQKFMNNVIRLYLQRLIAIEISAKGIRRREWELLEDFRAIRIQRRLSEYYDSRMDAMTSDIRSVCTSTQYCGLIKKILLAVSEQEQISEKEMDKILQTKEAEEMVKKKLLSFFYELPAQMVTNAVVSGTVQYLKTKMKRVDDNV